MTINNQFENSTLTMMIEGRIDTQTAPDLLKAVEDSIGNVSDLVLDFTNVSYISSAGLRSVLKAQNYMDEKGGTMVIRGAAKNIKNIFNVKNGEANKSFPIGQC